MKMALNLPFSLFPILFLISLSSQTHYSAAAAAGPKKPNDDLVRSSCVHASYPDICLRTLSSYDGPANTPGELAQAAVKVSLSRAQKVSDYLATLRSGGKREQAALRDCVEQVGDSVEELSKSLSELQHLGSGNGGGATFRWQMSNAETWVSAALTNEDTCLDGFRDIDGKVRSDVRRKITNVARVTSNALYLINRLDQTRPKAVVVRRP